MTRDVPFFMHVNTAMERYRWDTFWTKEPETLAWIDSFEPGAVFWDIGANVGVYSLYAASLDRGLRIYAFEPHPANNSTLHYNRDYNRFCERPTDFQNMVILVYALGEAPGEFRLSLDDQPSGCSGAQVNDESGCKVMVETVDSLVETFPVPDYVKIDIDGQELSVVRGMLNTLPEIKSVLVEVSSKTRVPVSWYFNATGFTAENRFNALEPHSRQRRKAEGIDAENIVFTR